jgi:hypothetical protein
MRQIRHRAYDLFSRPGTIEPESLGSHQIRAKTSGVKRAVRDVLRNGNGESHFLSVSRACGVLVFALQHTDCARDEKYDNN